MATIRADYQIFPFSDSVKTPISAGGATDSFHNHGYRSMTIEVAGDVSSVSATVQVCINTLDAKGNILNDEQVTWIGVPVVNASTGEAASSITAKGIYRVDITGLSRVRLNVASISGEMTAVGVATRYPIQFISGGGPGPTPVDPESPLVDTGQADYMKIPE